MIPKFLLNIIIDYLVRREVERRMRSPQFRRQVEWRMSSPEIQAEIERRVDEAMRTKSAEGKK